MKLSLHLLMTRISTSMLRPFAAACLVAVASLGWTGWAAAAACSSTNYDLNTQAEVDALGATGCDSVSGDLRIEQSSDITQVDALTAVTSVGGLLSINNNGALLHLDGLANVSSIGGELRIFTNPALNNIDGLINLTGVGSGLAINANAALNNIDGLANLSVVGGFISIQVNDSLASLDGLIKITSVEGQLDIADNPSLTNLNGLVNITSIAGPFYLRDNDALANIDGLSNLASVGSTSVGSIGGNLHISDNAVLTNIDGLSGLVTVGGGLALYANPALSNIDGLINFESAYAVTISNALITNINALSSLTSVASLYFSENNALTNLNGLSNISGPITYLTLNSNYALIDIDGLSNITAASGWIKILNNPVLPNIDGLLRVASVSRLEILGNGALTNLDGLASLTYVGTVEMRSNPSLSNLDGLSNLASVEGLLRIASNATLANCQGIALLLGWPDGPPDDTVGGQIAMYSNASGCNSYGEVLASVASPSPATITGASAVGTSIALGFIESTTTDTAFPISGYRASCIGSEIEVSRSPATFVGANAVFFDSPATDLLDNTPINEVLTVSDYSATSPLSSIEIDIDITHSDPADLVITLTTPEGTELLMWDRGSTGGEDLVGTFPTSLTSVDSLNDVARQEMEGNWMLSIEDVDVGPIVREGILNSWGVRITEELQSELEDNVPIQETLSIAGYDPTAVLSSIEVDIDISHSNPSDLYITLDSPQGTELVLWNEGIAVGADLIGTFPTTLTPVDSLSSIARQEMDGDWLLSIEDVVVGSTVSEGVLNSYGISITEELARSGDGSPIELLAATRGRDYTCTVAPVTKLGVLPLSDAIMVSVPLELPATPTVTSTDYEDGTIRLTVSVADNGGADITEYSASCTDGTSTPSQALAQHQPSRSQV